MDCPSPREPSYLMTEPHPESAGQGSPVLPTVLVQCERLSQRLGIRVTLASETFQRTGSFKFRAAYNVASQVPHGLMITASSGNFGQALACACRLLGKQCIIVMPETSAKVKIEAVREYGGAVELVNVAVKSRGTRVAELAQQYPEAYVASAYDDPLVIRGNASLGRELAGPSSAFDSMVAPIGGGGLTSGIITGLREAGGKTEVIAAEPRMANDAARSFQAGEILANPTEPQTIADGARTLSVGRQNWPILRKGLARIVEVPEDKIKEAVRLLFQLANLKSEPTGALSVAALLTEPEKFKGRHVCCVISGGNVDADVFRAILMG